MISIEKFTPKEMHKLLSICAGDMLIVGGLCFLGSAFYVLFGLLGNEWPEISGYQWSDEMALKIGLCDLFIYGAVTMLILPVMHGNLAALFVSTILACCGTAVIIWHVSVTGLGYRDLIYVGILALHLCVTLLLYLYSFGFKNYQHDEDE